MKFVCYTEWDQLPESANALFARGEKDSIFFSRSWFENLTVIALDNDQPIIPPPLTLVKNQKELEIPLLLDYSLFAIHE